MSVPACLSAPQGRSSNNVIEGNRIGTDTTGTTALANASGVAIQAGTLNTVGGTTSSAQNLISGNAGAGVDIITIFSPATAGNVVEGNLIGTDATGGTKLPNDGAGVSITGAENNTVGGTVAGCGM